MPDYQPLTIKRTFNASRQAVWDAWTVPEQFKQWYMPAPYSVGEVEFDVRPGGQLRVETVSPDGAIQPVVGEFKVVEAPEKLVTTNSPLDAEGNKLFEVQHSFVLTEVDGLTTIDLTSEVVWAGDQAAPYLVGMEPGLLQALDQLAALVS